MTALFFLPAYKTVPIKSSLKPSKAPICSSLRPLKVPIYFRLRQLRVPISRVYDH